MKSAYCSGCGSYVLLDDSGECPSGHPRPCYRDIRDVSHAGDAASPVSPAAAEPTARGASSLLGPAGRGELAEPLPVPPVARRKWPWILAAVSAGVLVSSVCLVAITLGSRLLGSTATRPASPYPPAIPSGVAYVAPTPEQQRWALATSGILTVANGERHDLLGGCERTPENIQVCNKGLSDWWGINSRASLLDSLAWIENGGHRKDFDAVVSQVASASPEQLVALRSRVAGNAAASNELEVALRYGTRFGARSISGWDYSRYVFLCRRGYLGGYLTEEEAWRRIMPVARLLQATFGSWQELGDNYLAGREYWSLGQTQKDGELFNRARDGLLSDPESPWVRLPWNLDLGQAVSGSD